ncbi:peptidase S41 [Candidatus Wolfebacteria bacterium]|nr:MAG: peptidase S41 [Candidatus Wolfebacteria bacterium]
MRYCIHMKSRLRKISYVVIPILLLGVFFIVGLYIGFQNSPSSKKVTSVFNKESSVVAETDFASFWKVWNLIDEKHPAADSVSDLDRVYGAIGGLVDSLDDPYSVFFSPEEAKAFAENINGQFGGVGIEIGLKDNILTVIAPLKDTPAYNSGIQSGDKIIKIDDMVTSDVTIERAVTLIRGEIGTDVMLTIFRDGEDEPLEFTLTRAIINIPTIETEQLDDNIFLIRLFSFSTSSPELFRDSLQEFIDSNSDKLILDLRGNPGGFLEASIDIASWFLPSGKIVVTEAPGTEGSVTMYRSKGYDIFTDELQFVVLIDSGSASASEILAGALQQHDIATLVGTATFGKGSVQELIDITSDTSLKITIAEWLTPDGTSISESGLAPDIEVMLTREDIEAERDLQLDKAIELLTSGALKK